MDRRRIRLVPETVRGRVRLSPAGLAVIAVLVAAALAATAWLVIRDQARVAPLSVQPVGSALVTPSPLSPVPAGPAVPRGMGVSTGAAAGVVTVDVAGKVRHPGIVTLPAGSRVVDALEAAGGVRRGVDLTALNQARPLVDGEQVLVGKASVPSGPAGAGSVTPGPAGGGLVSLNTADETTLETLPGVGPVTAQAIISWRTAHGGFSSVNELLEVDGIGDVTLARLAPLVTL